MAKKSEKEAASAADYATILKPVITEKSSTLNAGAERGAVVFEVRKTATKLEVKTAVERIFDVEVEKVRVANYRGKVKMRGRSLGRTADYKRAFVTLAPGNTIDLVEGL